MLLLPALLACSLFPTPAPRNTGQLSSERSQVYLAAGGAAGQEVPTGASRTAGTGDEIWTVSGRALLKFSDLWIRLYDDTSLHADDVTPSSVKTALGAGATLVGATPGVYDRVEITVGDPPHARITLAGTLVMISHVPGRRITLVRSFGGRAEVASAVTGASRIVNSTEWVMVGSGNQVEVIADEERVRQLAQELGVYALFHDIELDAGSFGPPGAAVTAADIAVVFGPASPSPCPPPSLKLGEPVVRDLTAVVEGSASPGCREAVIQRVTWDWGDGQKDDQGVPGKHQYAQGGRYRVTATAYDNLGQSGSAQVVVSVSAATQPPQPARPNLAIVTFRAPEKAACGEKLGDRVQVVVANRGNAEAGTFAVRLVLSESQQVTPNSPALVDGLDSVEQLAAGASVNVLGPHANQIPTSLPEGSRQYWLGVIVDVRGGVAESDENDNTAAVPISITCLK
ncbi:MAG: PKD domain-containing protein [Chloroflexi bacterium]|nr:PKD domain-containing protein [Chloroflexota bacterium]